MKLSHLTILCALLLLGVTAAGSLVQSQESIYGEVRFYDKADKLCAVIPFQSPGRVTLPYGTLPGPVLSADCAYRIVIESGDFLKR